MTSASHRTGWRKASAHIFAMSFLALTDKTVAQFADNCDECPDGQLCMMQVPPVTPDPMSATGTFLGPVFACQVDPSIAACQACSNVEICVPKPPETETLTPEELWQLPPNLGAIEWECKPDPCLACSDDELCVEKPPEQMGPEFPGPPFPVFPELPGSPFPVVPELPGPPFPVFPGAIEYECKPFFSENCGTNGFECPDGELCLAVPPVTPDPMSATGTFLGPVTFACQDPCQACSDVEICVPKPPGPPLSPFPVFPGAIGPEFPGSPFPGFEEAIEWECIFDPCQACSDVEVCVLKPPETLAPEEFEWECKPDPCQACSDDEICVMKPPETLIPEELKKQFGPEFTGSTFPGFTESTIEWECKLDPCQGCSNDEICVPKPPETETLTPEELKQLGPGAIEWECKPDPCQACSDDEICVSQPPETLTPEELKQMGPFPVFPGEWECKSDPCFACTETQMCVHAFGKDMWAMECQEDPCLACEDDEICMVDFVSEAAVDSAVDSWLPSFSMKCEVDPCTECVLQGGMCMPRFDSFMNVVMSGDGFGFEVNCLLDTGCEACDLDNGELCLPEIDQDAPLKMACKPDPCAACKQEEVCVPDMDGNKKNGLVMKCIDMPAIPESSSSSFAPGSAPSTEEGTECMPVCKQKCNDHADQTVCMQPCAAKCAQQFIYKQAAAARPPGTNTGTNAGDSESSGTDENGFDFGSGCEAGTGQFTRNLAKERGTSVLGIIPADKYGVKVNLISPVDIDIQLLDVAKTDKFSEGAAIVAYCETVDCNRDNVFGISPGEVQADYSRPGIAPMRIKYSGYNGVNGRLGDEFIEVSGATTTDMLMRVYAYRIGQAEVEYSWQRSLSPCCRGLESCPGEPFSKAIIEKEIVAIGEIPVGKKNIRIQLKSDQDVDVQLYDTSDTGDFDEGNALIGYCESAGCNFGTLAGPGRESFELDGVEYVYSGYNGDGHVGHEYIEINGVTNRPLVMKAFGYTAGMADVTYSWYELEI